MIIPTSGVYKTGVLFRGINRAQAEYGEDWNGWTGQTFYKFPPTGTAGDTELNYLKSKGFNTIRFPIAWERLQRTLNGAFNNTYKTNMLNYITQATGKGFHVVLDLHNYNRYATGTHNSSGTQVSTYVQRVMGDGYLTIAHLADVWTKLANLLKTNPKVMYNLMNESHDFPMTSTNWVTGINTVISAIRGTGSTQLILVPNSRSSDISHWSTYSPNGGPLDSVAMLNIVDSANNYVYDQHAYNNNSQWTTHLTSITNWARTNGKQMFMSELGGGDATQTGAILQFMNDNSDVWVGWTPWNLPPYNLTDIPNNSFSTDGPQMSYFTPYMIPNFLDLVQPSVTYNVTYNWGSGYCCEISIANNNSIPLTWKEMKLNMNGGTIRDQNNTGMPWDTWDGYFAARTGSSILVKPLSNTTIPAYGTVKVGFCADFAHGSSTIASVVANSIKFP